MKLWKAYAAGTEELVAGLRNWRIWHLLGTADLRRRHSRSKFGQLWIALSTGVTVLSLSLVWSLLWGIPVATIMPYITVAMILWGFISGVLAESTSAFTATGNLFLNQKTSMSVAIYTIFYKTGITTLYNMSVVILIFAWFWTWPSWQVLLFIPGLLVNMLFLVPICYMLAVIATRFRDAVPLTQSVIQIGYLVTPVLWRPDFMPIEYRWINLVNPFSVYLSLLRDPLLGMPTTTETWWVALSYAALSWIVGLAFIGHFHKRVIYWI
ncbi:ABC transporter permease [Rhizobium sp. AQ_MP]|jgi:ABC-type polysaccharide/polyol phosphate export permease|uniref:ABC transporter permease n=1 Tax=Rhizobium sp. AQ_MP TaxID=2761536 RepID=UPI00163AA77A|nr:ABC transporter permease [Rhizobium sp. AQ_MP]MBC2774688.1 ABC transporter permease [Rhizobium sp. AQ_MP]